MSGLSQTLSVIFSGDALGFKTSADTVVQGLANVDRRAGETSAALQQFGQHASRAMAEPATAGQRAANEIAQALTSYAAVTVSAYGAYRALSSAIGAGLQYAEAIKTQSERLQISAEAVQEWGYAAERSGLTAERLNTAVFSMQRVLSDTKPSEDLKAALDALGLSFSELRQMRPEEQFTTLASAISRLPEGFQQTQAATAIFGRNASELMTLLQDFDLRVTQARQDHVILTAAETKAIGDLRDEWENLKRDFSAGLAKGMAGVAGFVGGDWMLDAETRAARQANTQRRAEESRAASEQAAKAEEAARAAKARREAKAKEDEQYARELAQFQKEEERAAEKAVEEAGRLAAQVLDKKEALAAAQKALADEVADYEIAAAERAVQGQKDALDERAKALVKLEEAARALAEREMPGPFAEEGTAARRRRERAEQRQLDQRNRDIAAAERAEDAQAHGRQITARQQELVAWNVRRRLAESAQDIADRRMFEAGEIINRTEAADKEGEARERRDREERERAGDRITAAQERVAKAETALAKLFPGLMPSAPPAEGTMAEALTAGPLNVPVGLAAPVATLAQTNGILSQILDAVKAVNTGLA